MKLNIKNYIILNSKELLRNGLLIVGLLSAIVPSVIISYFILHNQSPFQIKHVSNFYCMLGLLFAVLQPVFLINRDFSNKTISLINNSPENRRRYFGANLLLALMISMIFALIGVVIFLLAKSNGVTGSLPITFLLDFIINYFVLVSTYFLIAYLLFTYHFKSQLIYVVLALLLLFFPNILASVQAWNETNILGKIIDEIPLYFLPALIASRELSLVQHVISFLFLGVLGFFVFKRNMRYEA